MLDAVQETDGFSHYHALARYCRLLAGTPWDGEDLLQETILKVWRAFPDVQQRNELPKSYWFRVATNTRIDEYRKRKLDQEPYEEDRVESESDPDPLEIDDALERLVALLPPKQAAILLLVDVFRFTTRETAELLEDMSDGAVKTALRRARSKLAAYASEETVSQPTSTPGMRRLLDEFTTAVRKQNPMRIVRAYHALSRIGVQVERVISEQRISFTFTDPEGNMLMMSMVK